MENAIPTMTRLFEQLGLPSLPADIEQFIAGHRPLAADVMLFDAPFWTQSQADFLRGEMLEDADWAIVIERVNAALRTAH